MLEDLFYDWNEVKPQAYEVKKPDYPIALHDETLRDGLQSPSVSQPTEAEMLDYLNYVNQLPIDNVTIGFPCVSKDNFNKSLNMARAVASNQYSFGVGMTARTVIQDIVPIVKIRDQTNVDIEAQLFLGCSKIRQFLETWTLDDLIEKTCSAISYAKQHGLRVIFVTEDTTRAHPETIETLYLAAASLNVERVNVCDTTGYITPCGTYSLVNYVRKLLDDAGYSHVGIDFHGHMDRGLGLWNSIVALSAGADRLQACALGVGERTGNTPLEQALVNLKLMGWIDAKLDKLDEYAQYVSNILNFPISPSLPVVGKDAFLTGSGVHAAAINKAKERKDTSLADSVYSAVPASWVGRQTEIVVGPMSGSSNVVNWLREHGYPIDSELIDRILYQAKSSMKILEDLEIISICEERKTMA